MANFKAIIKKSPLLLRVASPLHGIFVRVMSKFPIKGAIPSFSGPQFSISRFESKLEYDRSSESSVSTAEKRRAREMEIAQGRNAFKVSGYCAICDAPRTFNFIADSARGDPGWRETGFCESCGFSSRMRYSLHILLEQFSPLQSSDVYIAEQFTKSYRWLKGRFPRLVGSEYLSAENRPGEMSGGIRHEDLQALSFANSSLDYLLSFEVMEHVPDLERATSEAARVLRSGGRLFFTAPFRPDAPQTIKRASLLDDGTVTHHLPPEIHGNPTNPKGGALCFRHFGWDYLDVLRSAGFRNAEVITFWSEQFGYMATPVIVTAVKT